MRTPCSTLLLLALPSVLALSGVARASGNGIELGTTGGRDGLDLGTLNPRHQPHD